MLKRKVLEGSRIAAGLQVLLSGYLVSVSAFVIGGCVYGIWWIQLLPMTPKAWAAVVLLLHVAVANCCSLAKGIRWFREA